MFALVAALRSHIWTFSAYKILDCCRRISLYSCATISLYRFCFVLYLILLHADYSGRL